MTYQLREENVIIESDVKLAGTVLIPIDSEKTFPAVLILPGSGGSDRDGNNQGLEMGIYKYLAEFLTGLGFVTLRFDKRGTHQSEGDPYARGFQDMVVDATACLRYLKNHQNVDSEKTIILGHSEGSQLTPAVYVREKAAGVVLLCGGAMGLQEILNWQRQQAYDALEKLAGFKGWLIRTFRLIDQAKKTNAKFETKVMNGNETVVRAAGKKFPAKWMREFYQYDVESDIRRITCPVLVIAGKKDIQVPLEAGEKVLSLVSGQAELHVMENMTHILKDIDDVMDAANPLKIYKKLTGVQLSEDLKSCIYQWLNKYFQNGNTNDEIKVM